MAISDDFEAKKAKDNDAWTAELNAAPTRAEKDVVGKTHQAELRRLNAHALYEYRDRYQMHAVDLREKLNDKLPGERSEMITVMYSMMNQARELQIIAADLEKAAQALREKTLGCVFNPSR